MQVEAFQADLCDEKQTVELYERVKKRFGRVDCVFINHGINGGKHLGPLGDMDDVSVEDFKSTWQANTLSPFVLTKCCIKEMASRGYGRIIYCSSVAALTGGVIGPHYSSSKSALHGMMRWAANRYAKEGVTVNAVAPALIDGTGMINTDEKPEMKDALQKNIPIGRLGTVEEVADVVLLLLTNSYITSKCWSLDGGWVHQ
ncbi:NAD(P)-binding protein [Ceraceosorus guamensis]|uniref:NAD(P)-binding protein n=1 Tax=Ceraceosorus guamensis TaxID=1522189 RepID=A0A316VRL6_9BASI|nr:NAD(P)-binding protein [Ceraceosorus guamensis]PWN40152.1 NAD(P)-binding protein [Ceraceosorus guamensis]